MNYTVNQLRIFAKVIQTQSITKAAEELFMTQPAVSIQLRNFQDQFDIPLTEVIGRRLYITEFWKEIGQIAERVLNEMEAINYKTHDYQGFLTGKLKISSASTGKYILPYFLSGFMKVHKGIDLQLDVTNKSQVMESILKNETDFAFVSVVPDKLNIEEEILITNKLYLFSSDVKRDTKKALIYREPGSATRQAMEKYFGVSGEKDRKKLELTSNEAVKQAVIAGLGYSIMPLIGNHNELEKEQLHILPAKGLPIITEWRLIWLKGKSFSPVAKAFLEYIRENKQNIQETAFEWYQKH